MPDKDIGNVHNDDSEELRNKRKELCDYLRNTRESRHISLEKLSKDTKLNLDYLYAIEQGDFEALPAEAYVRIYLRSVAKYLKMDVEDVEIAIRPGRIGPDQGNHRCCDQQNAADALNGGKSLEPVADFVNSLRLDRSLDGIV
jgi:transcriptional regulator with XRE-family HTH domain